MKKRIIASVIITSLMCFKSTAQMVGTSGYIKGTSVEIGIDGVGGFEGANKVTFPPPTGMHPRSATNFFGFVANPQVNAWAQFNGDYFTPGAPENGWGIQVGTLQKSNNCNGPLYEIPGTLSYTHVYDCYDLIWNGSVTSGTTSIGANIKYHLEQNDLFYSTTVTLTNNSTAVIPLMYYYRTLDPDNNYAAPGGGNYATDNTIENQPGVGGGCNDFACVSASQTLPWPSYMALAAIGSDFRVTRGGTFNRSAANIWNAVPALIGSLGTSVNSVDAISLAYRIQNFLPGTSRTFKFLTILRQSDKTLALSNLLNLTYPGSTSTSGVTSACTASVTPDTVKLCGPNAIISVNGSTNGYYNWNWTPTTFLSSSNTYSTIVTPTVQTKYTITGVPTSTCVSPNNVTYTVVVVPSPTFTPSSGMLPGSQFFMSVNSPLIKCFGETLNLTSSGNGGVGATYSWTGPGGYTSSSPNNTITVSTATNVGTYTVTSTTTLGCVSSATTSVSFVSTNSITVTPSITACQGGILALTANAPGATFYSWSGPSSFTSSVQNPTVSISAMPVNSGVYTVTAYFVVGTTSCTTVNTCTATVLASAPLPLVGIPTACLNGTINLNAPSGGTLYNWVGPNSFTASVQNPSINNISLLNVGTYTVTVTALGCSNSGTVSVSVYPALNFASTSSNFTVCGGIPGTLSASGNGGTGTYNYLWTPSTNLSAPNSSITSVTATSTTIYTLSLSDANCAATIPAITTITVDITPSPVITMTTSNNRGCEPFYTDLIGTSVPTATNCQWHFSSNLGFSSCSAINFCFPTTGVYGATLTVTDINGCVDSLTNNAFVTVDPKPIVDFSWTPDNPNILVNEISYNDLSTVGLPMTYWHWDFGDIFVHDIKDTSNIQNPSHVYDNANSYSVSLAVINTFGCMDTLVKIIKINDDFAIFIPKTFSPIGLDGLNDIFKVSGIGFQSEGFEMKIFDRWGDLIFSTNDVNKGWDGTTKGGRMVKQDTYVYKVIVKDYKNKTKEFVGHITAL